MVPRKMTRGQLRPLTIKILQEQGGVCLVCKKPIDLSIKGNKGDGACLDHCHESGHVRGVLHRSCNGGLGKMDSAVGRWIARSMRQADIVQALENALAYYKMPVHNVLYHSHKSEDDKRAARALAQKKRRAEQAARLAMKRGKE